MDRYNLEPRKIYQFHKANKEVILAEVCKLVKLFLRKTAINEPLRKLASILNNLVNIVDKYIPYKLSKPHREAPWLNFSIKVK